MQQRRSSKHTPSLDDNREVLQEYDNSNSIAEDVDSESSERVDAYELTLELCKQIGMTCDTGGGFAKEKSSKSG